MLVYTCFDKTPLLFRNPRSIITCREPSKIFQTFEQMEQMLDQGCYLAGFLSYEAGYCLGDKLPALPAPVFPLICMGCYKLPVTTSDLFAGQPGPFRISDMRTLIPFHDYCADIERIRSLIAAGEVYQITYCLKMKFSFGGSAHSLFSRLLREQPVPYPAYIETGDYKILSFSPEMFIRKKGSEIRVKPMKGTWPRGKNGMADLVERYRFKHDIKNRAENVMIADLLRNDLGRIGRGVRVTRLFEVTGYRTLYQMTSSISAEMNRETSLYSLFKALFPSGSVTGAPKLRSMEAIRAIEKEERKIYTGAIGYITPAREMYFSVPIRTILLENGHDGELGIGGGIIWDSTPEGEWNEGMLKAKFLELVSK